MSDYFIARQPIFDAALKVFAYELLFRNSDSAAAPLEFDDDSATAHVLTTSEDVGLSRLVGEHTAFINLPARFLSDPDLLPLPPDGVVLEVLEHVRIDEQVLQGMRTLAERGYSLALDDYVYDARFDAALPYVSIVKLEIPRIAPNDWAGEITRLKGQGIRVLAEKVETAEEFERLAELGCDYFQGFFFARPRIVSGKRLAPNRLAMLQIIAKVNDPESDIEVLSELVSQDMALSVRAMNYANSAASGLNRKIESVREAVVYIGRETIRRWVTLLLMAKMDEKPGELITMGLIRGKFLELLAKENQQKDHDAFFTAGLFSVLDSLMDAPMSELVEKLSISGELAAALLEGTGLKGDALNLVRALERGQFSGFDAMDIGSSEIAGLHRQATHWADDTLANMGMQ